MTAIYESIVCHADLSAREKNYELVRCELRKLTWASSRPRAQLSAVEGISLTRSLYTWMISLNLKLWSQISLSNGHILER